MKTIPNTKPTGTNILSLKFLCEIESAKKMKTAN